MINLMAICIHKWALAPHPRAHKRMPGDEQEFGADSEFDVLWRPAVGADWQQCLQKATTWTAVYTVELDADDVLHLLDHENACGQLRAEVHIIDGKPATPSWQRVGSAPEFCSCPLCLSSIKGKPRTDHTLTARNGANS